MAFDAGSITASLDVDKTPFQEGLDQAKADAAEFADQTYKATLGVDTEQGDTDRDEFKSKLDEIGQLEETAKLNVSAGDSQATVDHLGTSLDEIGAKSVTSHVNVNVNGEEEVALLKVDLDELDAKRVTIPVNVDGAATAEAELLGVKVAADAASGSGGGGLSGLEKDAEDLGTGLNTLALGADSASGGGGSGGLSGLASAAEKLPDFLTPTNVGLATLATGLIPIGGLAAGAAIGLTGMAAAAGAGIGAFALAALPVYTQVSAALTQISTDQAAVNRATSTAQENTAVTHLNDDLKNLSPTVATVVEGVLNVKQAFTDWDAQFQPEILNVFNAALADVEPLLSDITPLVHAGAGAMQTFFESIGQVAKSPAFGQFIQFLANEAPGAISTITTAIEDFGTGFANVLERGAPLITQVEHGIVDLANGFKNFTTSKTFEDFMTWLSANGPQIVADIEKIGIAVGHIITVLAPLGLMVLNWVADVAQAIGKIGTLVNDLANFFTQTIPHALSVTSGAFTEAFQSVHNIVNTVWHAIDNDFVHPLTDFFENTIPHIVDDFVGFFTAIPGRVNHVWSDVVNALHAAWSDVANWVNDNLVQPVVHFFEGIPGFIAHVWSDVVNAIHDAWSVVANWVHDNVITPVVNFFESIPGAIAHVWSDVVSALEGAWNAISGWVDSNVIQPVVGFFEGLPGLVHHVWSDVVNDLHTAWSDVSNWVKTNLIDPVVKFFTDMPDNIKNALVGLADKIEQPFKDALGPIETVVNTIEGWLGDIGIHIGNVQAQAQQAGAAVNAINAINPVTNPNLNNPGGLTPSHAAGTGLGTFTGTTWVGEQGPELVNFGSPVQIIPNSAFSNLSGQSAINAGADFASFSGQGSSPMSVEINITIQNSGQSSTAEALTAATTQIVDELARELSSSRL